MRLCMYTKHTQTDKISYQVKETRQGNDKTVATYLEINVGKDQLLIGGVDDRGPVAAGEHVCSGLSFELAQNGGLGPQSHLNNPLVEYTTHFLITCVK